MKIAAGWFKEGRGLAIGILVGALTLGSASPHLVRWAVSPEAWRIVLVVAAASAVAGGLLMLLIPGDGPFAAPSPPFSLSAAPRMLKDRGVLLANLGYLGHMWEVYAMWTWMAAFVAASERARRGAGAEVTTLAALVTFAVIGSGSMGCWLGGKYGDRWGRTYVTSAAMVISGSCALLAGPLFGMPLIALVPVLLVWGITVVADSAQFSAAVSELAPSDLVGTALTLQTSLGFLLTCATVYLLPKVAEVIGWRWSMSVLAIGPALGVWAMLALRRRPEARLLAGGAR
jgi:predicted MFS family arabinose efflux permease